MDASAPPLQALLQQARRQRRLSQLELALRLGVSQRHLSFVESGRARPSRALLLAWLQVLEVPLAARNGALQLAGYAPAFAATPLDAPALAHMRFALERLLQTHDPMPAMVIGPDWELLQLNRGARWLADTLMPGVLEASGVAPNMLDLLLHPQGLMRHLVNVAEAGADFLAQLRADQAQRPHLAPRVEAFAQWLTPHLPASGRRQPQQTPTTPSITLRFSTMHGELAFFRMFSTFGSPSDITLASLRVEHLFAADEHTYTVLQALTGKD